MGYHDYPIMTGILFVRKSLSFLKCVKNGRACWRSAYRAVKKLSGASHFCFYSALAARELYNRRSGTALLKKILFTKIRCSQTVRTIDDRQLTGDG